MPEKPGNRQAWKKAAISQGCACTRTTRMLSLQRFWDHMDRIDGDKAPAIWKQVLNSVIEREGIDLSSVCYDGTNFYYYCFKTGQQ